MRHFVTMAAAGLILSGCASLNPPPPAAAPLPVPSGVGDQNRFVPPPGGFEAAAAAARESALRNPPPGTTGAAAGFGPVGGTSGAGFAQPGTAGAAGFTPLDDGFAAAPAAPVGGGAAAAAGAQGPNIVEYALRTSHPVGTPLYRRLNPLRWQTWERNCTQFPSQDAAQEAFLAAGGPESDRRNLDPDGDGYACWWTPDRFRRAMRAGE